MSPEIGAQEQKAKTVTRTYIDDTGSLSLQVTGWPEEDVDRLVDELVSAINTGGQKESSKVFDKLARIQHAITEELYRHISTPGFNLFKTYEDSQVAAARIVHNLAREGLL